MCFASPQQMALLTRTFTIARNTQTQTALLLIAHGSRRDEANADLYEVVAEMRRRGNYVCVEAAFLELAVPDIDQGAAACVANGAQCVVLLPYFLSAGVHVRRDLADIRQRLADQYPRVSFHLTEPLGPHPLLMTIVEERARHALANANLKRE